MAPNRYKQTIIYLIIVPNTFLSNLRKTDRTPVNPVRSQNLKAAHNRDLKMLSFTLD